MLGIKPIIVELRGIGDILFLFYKKLFRTHNLFIIKTCITEDHLVFPYCDDILPYIKLIEFSDFISHFSGLSKEDCNAFRAQVA